MLRPSEMASRSRGGLNEGEARALCQAALLLCDIVVHSCAGEFVGACHMLHFVCLYELNENTQKMSL